MAELRSAALPAQGPGPVDQAQVAHGTRSRGVPSSADTRGGRRAGVQWYYTHYTQLQLAIGTHNSTLGGRTVGRIRAHEGHLLSAQRPVERSKGCEAQSTTVLETEKHLH